MPSLFNGNMEFMHDWFEGEIKIIDIFSLMGLKYTGVYVDTIFTMNGDLKQITASALRNTEHHELAVVNI